MRYIEPDNVWMHVLPVTRWQFEKFILESNSGIEKDSQYKKMLAISPRVSHLHISHKNYEGAFISCVRLKDALGFANWMGDEYEIPKRKYHESKVS